MTDIFLRAGEPSATDIKLRDPTQADSGGTTYDVTVTDAGSSADTQIASAVFGGALSDAGAAADSQSAVALFVGALSEAGTVADSETALVDFVGARTESGTAIESETATATFLGATTEAATASDAQVGGLALTVDRTETATALDSETAAAIFAGALTDTLAGADAATGAAIFAASLAESGVAADSATGRADFSATSADAAPLLESAAAPATFAAAAAESMAALDEATGDVGGVTYNVTVDELLALADTADATISTVPDVTVVPAGFGPSSRAQQGAVFSVDQRESLTLADSQACTMDSAGGVADSLAVGDAVDATHWVASPRTIVSRISPTATATEQVTVVENAACTTDWMAAFLETVTLADEQTCEVTRDPWSPEDDEELLILAAFDMLVNA